MDKTIRFIIAGDLEYCEDNPSTFVEVTETDCLDLLRWLWLEPDTFGCIPVRDLAPRCRRRLWPIARNYDPGRVGRREQMGGAVRLVVAERKPGYLRACTEQLLKLVERAGPEDQILYS